MVTDTQQALAIEIRYVLGRELGVAPPAELVERMARIAASHGMPPLELVEKMYAMDRGELQEQFGIGIWPAPSTSLASPPQSPKPSQAPVRRPSPAPKASDPSPDLPVPR